MTLEAVVYPKEPFSYGSFKGLFGLGGVAAGWGYSDGFGLEEDKPLVGIPDKNVDHILNPNPDTSSSSVLQNVKGHSHLNPHSSPEQPRTAPMDIPMSSSGRRINECVFLIHPLVPPYVQRGNQASTTGGTINYVKELEQMLLTLEAKKRTSSSTARTQPPNNGFPPLFADFLSFPQYLTCPNNSSVTTDKASVVNRLEATADIELTVVESHANLKIVSKRWSRQLLKMVAGLQCLQLTVLHLNVTTINRMVLYSLDVMVWAHGVVSATTVQCHYFLCSITRHHRVPIGVMRV